jgi:hypothetical protein
LFYPACKLKCLILLEDRVFKSKIYVIQLVTAAGGRDDSFNHYTILAIEQCVNSHQNLIVCNDV